MICNFHSKSILCTKEFYFFLFYLFRSFLTILISSFFFFLYSLERKVPLGKPLCFITLFFFLILFYEGIKVSCWFELFNLGFYNYKLPSDYCFCWIPLIWVCYFFIFIHVEVFSNFTNDIFFPPLWHIGCLRACCWIPHTCEFLYFLPVN